MGTSDSGPLEILLCGDVMTGRGIDQVLPHPGNPLLYEPSIHDAREYIWLAERANGPIARPVDYGYIWGEALEILRQAQTDVRIINLETSITASEDVWPGKGINYRMHPGNIRCLTEAGIDCCCLANNHVLDWGYAGLTETLQTLDAAGLSRTGAGENHAEAAAPAVIAVPGKRRVLIFSLGCATSGIPRKWGATQSRAGVNLLEDLSVETAQRVTSQIRASTMPGDVVVVSIHWGGNWGYHIPDEQIRFAHRLVEAGVDIVHGHSSHHVKALEIYQGRPILYGCGDLLDDYEGIGDHETFRDDLKVIYRIRIDPRPVRPMEVEMIPMQVKRFQLVRASEADATWLCNLLNRFGSSFGVHAERADDDRVSIRVK